MNSKMFSKGDKVKITGGDLKGQTGTILQIINNEVWLKLDNKQITFDVEYEIKNIQKYFWVGDSVTIVSGKH